MIAVKFQRNFETALSNCVWGRYSKNRYFDHHHECIWSQHINPHFCPSLPPFNAHRHNCRGKGRRRRRRRRHFPTLLIRRTCHMWRTPRIPQTAQGVPSRMLLRARPTRARSRFMTHPRVRMRDMTGRAVVKGLSPRAAACHRVTIKPWRFVHYFILFYLILFDFIFPDLRRPQVGQKPTYDRSVGSFASRVLLDLRPPQVDKKYKNQCN